jgi:predicted DCC family thiol-disulfide oxidoreductase YuxK
MTTPSAPDARPLLVFDGDCGFCRYWVDYWRALTGERVRYEPWQRVAAQHPEIGEAEFRRAVQYLAPGRPVASGAEASLRVLAHAPGRGLWLWLYLHLPGFAWCAERLYAAVAAHRAGALRVSHALWGPVREPAALEGTARLFVAGLACVYLFAFLSLAVQITGLAGRDGLLPLHEHLAAVSARFGPERYWLFPTLFWIDASDLALQAACWAGAAAAMLALLGIRRRACLALMFLLYLSLFDAGQAFTAFQWDLLLLESGFLAWALWPRPALLVWVARWLVFRFLLMSGLVKLLGDPGWTAATALAHHFETQPLPSPLAWSAAQLPGALLTAGVVFTLVVELLLPVAAFLPRRPRFAAAAAIVAFQGAILLTGNYGFFNVLVIVLCIALLDDAALRRLRLVGAPRPGQGAAAARPPARRDGVLAWSYVAFAAVMGTAQLVETWRSPPPGDRYAQWLDRLSAPRLVNRYGPFRAMTAERPEIVLEASRDGVHWRELAFRFKPGDPLRRPAWNVPHQPRLDWQMWFAAMGTQREHPWFAALLRGVLRGTPEVRMLLDPRGLDGAPPRYLRAMLYDFRFADPAEHARGAWWTRRPAGLYFPAVRLDAAGVALEVAP